MPAGQSQAAAPRPSKWPRHGQPTLPDDVVFEHILTRVPACDAVRLRAVCRAWRAALTSDHLDQARRAVRAAAGDSQQLEIVFFRPSADDTAAAFYTCKLTRRNGRSVEAAPAARELLSVGNLYGSRDMVVSTKPCRGLTLLFQPRSCEYYVCNLSTGELVALPACAWANRVSVYAGSASVHSGAGLGFDAAAGEHKVARLFEDREGTQRCEVYSLGHSGGWRPCAGQVPANAAKGLFGWPAVFVDGCFYWHIYERSFHLGPNAGLFSPTPEPILSLAVGTEQFRWVHTPHHMAVWLTHIADLDGSLCAVVDKRGHSPGGGEYDLWTWSGGNDGGGGDRSWSLRCRISLGSLSRQMRDGMLGFRVRVFPLCSSPGGGEILLATSRHEVYAYDPGSGRMDRVFSVRDFVDAPTEHALMLNIALYEESIAAVRHRPGAGDDGGLMMKLGTGTVTIRRQGQPYLQRWAFAGR